MQNSRLKAIGLQDPYQLTQRRDQEARDRIERETRDRIERETRARIERETRDRIERETRDRIERETRDRIERETRARIERETRARIERETRDRIERETRDRIERKTRERIERETSTNTSNTRLSLERERVEPKTCARETECESQAQTYRDSIIKRAEKSAHYVALQTRTEVLQENPDICLADTGTYKSRSTVLTLENFSELSEQEMFEIALSNSIGEQSIKRKKNLRFADDIENICFFVKDEPPTSISTDEDLKYAIALSIIEGGSINISTVAAAQIDEELDFAIAFSLQDM